MTRTATSGFTGRTHTPESRAKMSASKTGEPHPISPDGRRKRSEAWRKHPTLQAVTLKAQAANRAKADRFFSPHHRRTASYGMGPGDYERMYEEQGGRCKVCGTPQDLLVVDHDHATGRIRGLLCNGCNLGVGHLERFQRLGVMQEVLQHVG